MIIKCDQKRKITSESLSGPKKTDFLTIEHKLNTQFVYKKYNDPRRAEFSVRRVQEVFTFIIMCESSPNMEPGSIRTKSSTNTIMMYIGKIAWIASLGGAVYFAKKLHSNIVNDDDINNYRATHYPYHNSLHGKSATFKRFRLLSNISPYWEEEFDTRMEKVCFWSAQMHALHLADIETFELFKKLFSCADDWYRSSNTNVVFHKNALNTMIEGINNEKQYHQNDENYQARYNDLKETCAHHLALLTKRLFISASILESMLNELHHIANQIVQFDTIVEWFSTYMQEYGNIYKRVFDASEHSKSQKSESSSTKKDVSHDKNTSNPNDPEYPWFDDVDTLRLDLEDCFKRIAFCNALKNGTSDVTNGGGSHLCLMHVRYWSLMHAMQLPGMRRIASSIDTLAGETDDKMSWAVLRNKVLSDISSYTLELLKSKRQKYNGDTNNIKSEISSDERKAFLSQGASYANTIPNITSSPMKLLEHFRKDTTVFGLLPMISSNMFSYLGPAPNEPCFIRSDKITRTDVSSCTLLILARIRYIIEESSIMAQYTSRLHAMISGSLTSLSSGFDHDTQHTISLAKIKISTLCIDIEKLKKQK